MRNLFADPVLGPAAWQAVLAGATCGAVGVHVLLRRLPFLVVALGHATLPGVALAAIAGVSVLVGGFVAGVAVAALVAPTRRAGAIDDASAIGVALACAFAFGVLIAGAGPPTGLALSDQLVGSVLFSDGTDIALTGAVGVAAVGALVVAHKELVLHAFDPEAAAAAGYRTAWVDLVLLVVIAATVVTALPAMGALLVAALLTVPALAARQLVDRIGPAMVAGAAIGAVCAYGGLLASYRWEVAAGGAIALCATAAFAVALGARRVGRATT